ncbi:MAG: type III-A CRISPR-associated protein Csm2 [Syntrophales bacterium]|jgi:CRISPR-associated protein Csm2|nr:type III-A CRISPR-associated protein Csm2 [Syntrophales bacterium]
MINFYKGDKEKRILDPKLFSDVAMSWAEKIHEGNVRQKDCNKRSQLRKFYDEVTRLNSQAKSKTEEWDNIAPFVNMLIAKAAYAEGRNKVSKDFSALVKHCIEKIENEKDLDVFATFFEALMGFYRKYGEN